MSQTQPDMYVGIIEETGSTGGNFAVESFPFDAPVQAGYSKHTTPALPFDISVLSMHLDTGGLNGTDRLKAAINPEFDIGLIPGVDGDIAADAADTSLEITIDASLMALADLEFPKLFVGQELWLDDGVNKESCGLILSIDKENNKVTVQSTRTNSFSATSPKTKVKLTTWLTPQILGNGFFEIGSGGMIYSAGESKIGASHIPKGSVFEFQYLNTGASVVRVVPKFDLLY